LLRQKSSHEKEERMKTREQLIVEILNIWVKDTVAAAAIDDRSYTHASCGYESAQSDVEEYLTADMDRLERALEFLKGRKV